MVLQIPPTPRLRLPRLGFLRHFSRASPSAAAARNDMGKEPGGMPEVGWRDKNGRAGDTWGK